MYTPFNKVIFRTPYYSMETLKKSLSDEVAFNEIIKSGIFKDAIYYASPDLYNELIKYINGELKGKDKIRTKNSLVKYLSRMSTRCTPFGIFASCTTGEIRDKTAILLPDKVITHVRFDMLYLCNLSFQLSRIKEIRQAMKYFINSTIYLKGNKLRYIEYRFNSEKRIYQLVEVSSNRYLNSIIKAAEKGVYIQDIISVFQSSGEEISEEDALEYIDSLIENQILISEIDPIVTGDDFFDYIMIVLERIGYKSDVYIKLKEIRELLSQLNGKENPETDTVTICSQIEEKIKSLNIPFSRKFLLQVDTVKEAVNASLSKDIVDTLQKAMVFLNKITPHGENSNLKTFKEIFSKRYEDREIPLLEALDPDIGIGYPSNQMNDPTPLIEGLYLPGRQGESFLQATINPLHVILQKKIMAFNPAIDNEILLNEEDVKGLSADWQNLPATIFTKFDLIKEKVDSQNFLLILSSFSGSSAGNLLGRFAYCDKNILNLVTEITHKEKERYSDYIVAEISHIPDSRVGNVLARPNIRDFEIVYLANTTRSRNEVIYPSDIYISIKNNQILLRSRSLNKYIIPRLTTAHNYHNNPTPIYCFLCEMQSQNVRSGIYFNWGAFDQQLEYLPRVRYENIILSLAKWKVKINDIKHLIEEKDNEKLKLEINKWRKGIRLPRYVTLSDNDNTLFVDMENETSIQTFFSVIIKRSQILLEEFLQNDNILIENMQGEHFTNECIVSFYKSTDKNEK